MRLEWAARELSQLSETLCPKKQEIVSHGTNEMKHPKSLLINNL
jgi:hypothetical protein